MPSETTVCTRSPFPVNRSAVEEDVRDSSWSLFVAAKTVPGPKKSEIVSQGNS